MTRVAELNYKYDYDPIILWQYSSAPNLKGIVAHEQEFMDVAVTQFRDEFDNNIFNLNTCDANGLELWGKLLQVSRPVVDGTYFTDEQYRLLLKSRIYLLTWDGSAYGLTKLLRSLFPEALFRVVDNLDMTANIELASGITPEQEVVLRMGYLDPITTEYVYTFLPRPSGVSYNIAFEGTWATTLGFEGMTETTNMGGAYNCDPDDHTGETGTENEDGGVFYK